MRSHLIESQSTRWVRFRPTRWERLKAFYRSKDPEYFVGRASAVIGVVLLVIMCGVSPA